MRIKVIQQGATTCVRTQGLSVQTFLTSARLSRAVSSQSVGGSTDDNRLCGWIPCGGSVFMSPSGPAGLSGLCQVTDHLYLSNGRAARDSAQVSRCKITCIISVTETRWSCPPAAGVEHIHIPLSDSPVSPLIDHFDRVSDIIQQTADGGGRTLVHCNAGVSRSSALCIAFLMRHRGLSLLEAHGTVRTCRPMVRPNTGFWKQLIRYEMVLRGCNSVRMVASSIGEIPDIYEEESRNVTPL